MSKKDILGQPVESTLARLFAELRQREEVADTSKKDVHEILRANRDLGAPERN